METRQRLPLNSDEDAAHLIEMVDSPRPSNPISRASKEMIGRNEKTSTFDSSSVLESGTMSREICQKNARVTETPVSTEELPNEGKGNEPKSFTVKQDSENKNTSDPRYGSMHNSTRWLLGAFLLAIPLLVLATAFPKKNIAGVRVVGIFIWLEIVWSSAWIIYCIIVLFGALWFALSSLLDHEAWNSFFVNTASAQLFFALSLVSWGSSSSLCRFTDRQCSDVHWLNVFRKILLATIPVSTLFLVQAFLVQNILTRQVRLLMSKGRHEKRIKFGEGLMYFMSDDSVDSSQGSTTSWACKALFFRRKPDKKHQRMSDYLSGEGDDQDFEQERKDKKAELLAVLQKKLGIEVHEDSEDELPSGSEQGKLYTALDSALRIFEKQMKTEKAFTEAEVDEIMSMIDVDGNKRVSFTELASVYIESFDACRDANKSIRGMNRAAKGVEMVLYALLTCLVAIVYAAFFTKNLSAYLTPIWTTFTGLSFALSGTATEFLSACSFVFSKQPYDVGDLVIIDGKELIVDDVYLLYTVFHRPLDGILENRSHKQINDLCIANLSRSRDLRITEKIHIPEKNGRTVTSGDLPVLQEHLTAFVQQNSTCERYLGHNGEYLSLSVEYTEDSSGKLLLEMFPRAMLNRREETLINTRKLVRDRLEDLLLDLVNDRERKSSVALGK